MIIVFYSRLRQLGRALFVVRPFRRTLSEGSMGVNNGVEWTRTRSHGVPGVKCCVSRSLGRDRRSGDSAGICPGGTDQPLSETEAEELLRKYFPDDPLMPLLLWTSPAASLRTGRPLLLHRNRHRFPTQDHRIHRLAGHLRHGWPPWPPETHAKKL